MANSVVYIMLIQNSIQTHQQNKANFKDIFPWRCLDKFLAFTVFIINVIVAIKDKHVKNPHNKKQTTVRLSLWENIVTIQSIDLIESNF